MEDKISKERKAKIWREQRLEEETEIEGNGEKKKGKRILENRGGRE